MQLAADRADQLGQPPLDRHVDVLVVGVYDEVVRIDLVADRGEPTLDLGQVAGRDDAGALEHARVRGRLLDVVRRQAVVVRNRRVERLEERILRGGEGGHRAESKRGSRDHRIRSRRARAGDGSDGEGRGSDRACAARARRRGPRAGAQSRSGPHGAPDRCRGAPRRRHRAGDDRAGRRRLRAPLQRDGAARAVGGGRIDLRSCQRPGDRERDTRRPRGGPPQAGLGRAAFPSRGGVDEPTSARRATLL